MKRIGCLLLLFCLLLVSCSPRGEHDEDIELYFLDVGQGDCILLRTREGDVLIDTGPSSERERTCFQLEKIGVEALELVVVTHFDEDHLGGGERLLSLFDVERIWVPSKTDDSVFGSRFLEQAQRLGIETVTVGFGEEFMLGGMCLTSLSLSRRGNMSKNDASIILQMEYGDARALFMADAEQAAEEQLLSFCGKARLSSKLCKIGHHGSVTSTTEAFLEAVSPSYAVISVGAENAYGHPHGEILSALEEIGALVYRTDQSGTLCFRCDGRDFVCEEAKGE